MTCFVSKQVQTGTDEPPEKNDTAENRCLQNCIGLCAFGDLTSFRCNFAMMLGLGVGPHFERSSGQTTPARTVLVGAPQKQRDEFEFFLKMISFGLLDCPRPNEKHNSEASEALHILYEEPGSVQIRRPESIFPVAMEKLLG